MIPLDDEPAVLGAASTRSASPAPRRRRRRRSTEGDQPKAKRLTVPLGEYSDVVYVWEPHTPSMPPLRPYLDSLWKRRHLMKAMSHADLRSRESRTFLGRIWWLLDPLIQAAIYYMVFALVRGDHSADIVPRLVIAIFLFNLAGVSMGEASNAIRSNRQLLFNSDFPRAMLPLTSLYKGLARFWPCIPVGVVAVVALDAPVTSAYLLFPVLFLFQLLMMVGMALLTSAATVFIPDAHNVISYLTRIFFFTTPIIWSMATISDRLKAVFVFQPWFSLFASYQTIVEGAWPSWRMLAPIVPWTFGLFLLGSWLFLRHEREFAVRL